MPNPKNICEACIIREEEDLREDDTYWIVDVSYH